MPYPIGALLFLLVLCSALSVDEAVISYEYVEKVDLDNVQANTIKPF